MFEDDVTDFAASLVEGMSPSVKQRPWMSSCQFIRGTVENLPGIIDECIAAKRFALDLETSGLDNRVVKDPAGRLRTVDHIAGVCVSPDGVKGYYIPLAHKTPNDEGTFDFSEANVPWEDFAREFSRLTSAVERGEAVAIFHNGKFDQEFLQFNGFQTLGEWDKASQWEDTLILAYMRNTRARVKGLKDLSAAAPDANETSPTGGPGLGMEMIELRELWGHEAEKKGVRYDFTTRDPMKSEVLWYGGSDAICTYRLFHLLHPVVTGKDSDGKAQDKIYAIEKACVAATRWMERNRIHVSVETVQGLITVGQKEWFDSIMEVYSEASKILKRDVMPLKYKVLQEDFAPDDPHNLLDKQLEVAEKKAKDLPQNSTALITDTMGKEWPPYYDVNSPKQLGTMFDEMGVPGLKRTESSKQVMTTKEEIERIVNEVGESFPFMGRIKRFREISHALSSYLRPMLEDIDPEDHTMRINFNAHKVDTGRYSTPAPQHAIQGWPAINLQSLPATYDPKRPECMARIRECITARREGRYIVAVDYSGVELRIVTNLSREPKWLTEFFHCANCDRTFDTGDGNTTPPPPPARCPNCGSDKIGDLHTLTALAIYGQDAQSRPDWKKLRGGAKCVHPDTVIIDQHSCHRIGTLPTKQDEFLTLSLGNTVWDGHGWQPLLETYGGGKKKLYHVVSRRGVLTCSTEHRIETADGVLLNPTELTRGIVLPELSVPTNVVADGFWDSISYKVFEGVPPLSIGTDSNLAYLAGLVLGDGTKSVSYCAVTHGNVSKTDQMGVPYKQWQEILMDACRKAGCDPVARKESVYLGSRHVIRFLAALQLYDLTEGTNGSRRLRIPDWVWSAGSLGLFPFLGGLFDTDGTVSSRDKNLSVTTKDPVFAGHIAAALQALGMQVSVDASWNKTYQKWYFRVKVFREDSVQFIPYMKHPGKIARLKAEGRVAKPECGRRKPNEVLLVLDAGEQECVDLHVGSETHLYWANGFSSHNSCNFAMCYGGGGSAAQRAVGVDKNEGWRIKNQFDKTYTGLEHWWKLTKKFAKQHAFVRTAFNRKYPLPDINSTDGFWASKAERNATNGPVQGSSADITKTAMAFIYRECKNRGWLDKCQMIITMHDELVFEIDGDILEEAIHVLVPIMTRNQYILAMKWPVPLTCDVEIGDHWAVPWDLNAMRYKEVRYEGNKKLKEPSKPKPEDFEDPVEYEKAKSLFPEKLAKWKAIPHTFPEVLRPLFKVKTPVSLPMIAEEGLPQPGEEDQVTLAQPEQEEPVQVEETAPETPEPPPSLGSIGASLGTPTMVSNAPKISEGVYEFQLTKPLTLGVLERIADVIVKCDKKGRARLKLLDMRGGDVPLDRIFPEPIMVNPSEFYFLAGSADV